MRVDGPRTRLHQRNKGESFASEYDAFERGEASPWQRRPRQIQQRRETEPWRRRLRARANIAAVRRTRARLADHLNSLPLKKKVKGRSRFHRFQADGHRHHLTQLLFGYLRQEVDPKRPAALCNTRSCRDSAKKN